MRVLALAFLLAAAVLGGCFGDKTTDYDRVEAEVHAAFEPFLLDAMGGPVDYDPGRHGAGHNMERVAYHNGFDDSGDPDNIPATGFYNELAVTDQYVYLSRTSYDGAFGGLSVLKLQKDRAGTIDPVLVGAFDGLGGSDVEVSDDERLAFVATQRTSIEQLATHAQGTQDPDENLPRGTYVLDIADKGDPRVIQFLPLPPNGVHTLTYHKHVDGNEYLIACTYDLLTNTVPSTSVPPVLPSGVNPVTQRAVVYQIIRTDAPAGPGAVVVQVNEFRIAEAGSDGRFIMPHDTSVQVHPVTNQTLLYVSYWDKGLRIVDFSEPFGPLSEIGSHTDFSPSGENAIHWSRPFPELIDGRHITVAEPEIVSNPDEHGQITFIDTTDPTAPRAAAMPQSHWSLPGDLGVQNLDFSPHNFDLFDGKVVLAHYHAGVWVIDVGSRALLDDPRSVGFTMDVENRTDNPRPSPFFWSAFEHDGLIYATDEGTGLYVYRYTGP